MNQIAMRGSVLRAPADNSRVVTFRASTPRIDRHGTRVDPSGLKTDAYDKNPIFVWGHDAYGSMFGGTPDMEHVLGRVIAHRKSSQAFDIDVEFATEDENPKAERAFKLVKKGFLNAVSIGFIPLKWHDEGEEAGKMPLRVYDEAEITEISLVSLPSNQDCIALSRHFFGGTAETRRYDLDEVEAMEVMLRAGAVLNRANKGKLTQAASLINEVLATAAKEEETEQKLAPPPVEAEPALARAADESEEGDEGPGVYMARPVKDADAKKIRKWAKERGITDIVEDLHVTIVASRASFPADEMDDDEEEIAVKIKGIKRLKDAIVLTLDAPKIVARHKAAREKGATHDFNSFQPHITLTYSGPDNEMPEDFPSMSVKLGPEFKRDFEPDVEKKTAPNSAPPALNAADIGAAASAAIRAYLMETAISDGIKRALRAA
jgi:hypothetical protein